MVGVRRQMQESQKLIVAALPKINMRKILLFLVTFWVIIYDNARMIDLGGHETIWFPIPRQFRVIELGLLIFLYVLAFTRKMRKRIFFVSICIAAFLFSSLFNLVLKGILSFDGIQDIYIRVAPLLLFTIFAQGRTANREELVYFVKFFCFVLTVNILVCLFLQAPTAKTEDYYVGLFEDAHLFCNVLLTFSATLFYAYLKSKKKVLLILSLVLLLISVFPSNEKVIALTVLFLALLYFRYVLRKQTITGKLGIIVFTLVLGFSTFEYFQNKDGGKLWARAQAMNDVFGLENLGPIKAWPMAFNEIKESPTSFLFGLGAGEYGWIAASRKVMEGAGSIHSKLFEFEFSNENVNNAGYLFRTNTWSSLLAEYGLFGFSIFIWILFIIIKGVKQSEPRDSLEDNLRFTFYFILIIVIYQGFFTPYSNWSVSVLMFPAMYLAAYFHQLGRATADRENSSQQ